MEQVLPGVFVWFQLIFSYYLGLLSTALSLLKPNDIFYYEPSVCSLAKLIRSVFA